MKTRLTMKESILVASTLFGMFFGAGNLIFPVHLGQLAGSSLWPTFLGFVVTAVGIPILGVAAIGFTHSDNLHALSSKVSKWYGYVFTCCLYLTIGPLFAIPRCCTTSFTTGVAPLLCSSSKASALAIFSFVFFAVVLFFSLRPGGIITWIGRIINPIFLLFLAVLIVAALIHPEARVAEVAPDAAYSSGSFFKGFIEGYGTMDAIAGLAFGVVVVDILRSLQLERDEDIASGILSSGLFTVILMALIYYLTMLMGVQSRGVFEISENGGIALAQISSHFLHSAGTIILAVTITFACLKTAIGLVTSCSEIFVKLFPKSLSYKGWAVIFTAFSFLISNVGLTAIISYSVPVLMLLYPLTIVLIALALCEKLFHSRRCVYAAVTLGAFIPAVFDFLKALPTGLQDVLRLAPVIRFAGKVFPLFSLGLGWLIPSILGLSVGLVLMKLRPEAAE